MRPSRRALLAGIGAAAVSAPSLLRAQGAAGALRERAAGLGQLHSIVVRRGGETLLAEAFRGPGLDAPANVKSVSKTLLALLTGILIADGTVPGVDAPILPILGLPPYGDARDAITIADLLTLRAGLESTSGGNYGAWIAGDDWVRGALARPLGEPGERFVYSTGTFHVLGAVLARAAGRDLLALFRERMMAPMGIRLAPWVRDPQGRYLGGNEMALTPRELARIGDMVLAGGQWDGAQVVPRAWIERSWEPRARSPWSGDAYGYGWFLTELGGGRAAYARGYGGQILAVAPEAGIVAAINSDPTRPARSGGFFGDLRGLLDETVRTLA